jgi:prevent-host-death family protein
MTTGPVRRLKPVPAAEANRQFSRMLRHVRAGRGYLVTSHGRPVARILPVSDEAPGVAAVDSLLARLESQRVVSAGAWSREDLYARESGPR